MYTALMLLGALTLLIGIHWTTAALDARPSGSGHSVSGVWLADVRRRP